MTAELATYVSVISLAISAFAWAVGAVSAPIIKHSYWDGLPKKLVIRQKIAGWANMVGAACAAAGVAFQAYASSLNA
jgi:hypothetical protein